MVVSALNAGAILAFSERPEKAVRPIVLGLAVPAAAYLLAWLWDRRRRRDGGHARVVLERDVFHLALRAVPVVDAADEGRDQRHAGVGAGRRLREGEEQRHVAMDALALEPLRGADPLPGAGELDKHPLAPYSGFLVERGQPPRLFDGLLGVEGQPRVDLGRDAAGDVLQDLAAELHEQAVHRQGGIAARLGHRALEQGPVARVRGRGEQERGIGGGVLRLPARHRVYVAGVGDYDPVLAEGSELIRHRRQHYPTKRG